MKGEDCSFEYHLRTGIFQLQKYQVSVSDVGIAFQPNPMGNIDVEMPFFILNQQIKSIFLDFSVLTELEIITEKQTFVGNIQLKKQDTHQIVAVFKKHYANRLTIKGELV